ncbi:MAG: F0F1 ATP synthase subunit A [Bryobacteraceae bacterium]
MHESELWITKLFNDYLAGVGNSLTGLVGRHAVERPWANFIVMQIVVAILLMVAVALLRPRLSSDRPGVFQQVFELIYGFVDGQAEEQVGHEGHKFVHYFGTIFIFILVCNLIGLIPCFESPTMNVPVTCGCAMATFFYYHLVGIQANGFAYIKHFLGPLWWLAWLMFPIEIFSHMARPLSLTIRLFANMFAGELVTGVFLKLTLFAVPVVFMCLHLFVGLLQAYIFMLLTMVYVAGAVAHEH